MWKYKKVKNLTDKLYKKRKESKKKFKIQKSIDEVDLKVLRLIYCIGHLNRVCYIGELRLGEYPFIQEIWKFVGKENFDAYLLATKFQIDISLNIW